MSSSAKCSQPSFVPLVALLDGTFGRLISFSCSETHLELTDGWYSIRTVVDSPLAELVAENKIQLGDNHIGSAGLLALNQTFEINKSLLILEQVGS